MLSSAVVMVSHADGVAVGEGADDLFDQHLRRRRAGGDAEARDRAEYRPVDVAGALHQRGARAAGALGHLLRRCVLEEFGEPTTIIASTIGATFLTTSWRLVVA